MTFTSRSHIKKCLSRTDSVVSPVCTEISKISKVEVMVMAVSEIAQ